MGGMTDAERAAAVQGTSADMLVALLSKLIFSLADDGLIDFDGTNASFRDDRANHTKWGSKTVAAAITPEALPTSGSDDVREVQIIADAANVGDMTIGDVAAQSMPVPKVGAGYAVVVAVENINEVYVKVGVDGDTAHYAYAYKS